MSHELLGNHKPSAEWYTPLDIKHRVIGTLSADKIADPCPAPEGVIYYHQNICSSEVNRYFCQGDGLEKDWTQYEFIYCNPPTPAAPWAKKAIETVQRSKDTVIIFACFSEAVIWQVNKLEDYPHVKVRNRINWIDGNRWVKKPNGDKTETMINGKVLYPNTNYLKPAKSPRNYNAFVLLSRFGRHQEIVSRFCEEFHDLGTIQLSRQVYKP